MRKGLFRHQAQQCQQPRLKGDVLVTPRLSVVMITTVLVTWLALVVWYLLTHNYSRQVTVSGWLEPSQGVVRLFAGQNNGRVHRILVREGERVNNGQALMIIRNDALLEEGLSLESTLLSEYDRQYQLLEEQLRDTRLLHQRQVQQSREAVVSLERDLEEIDSLQRLLQQRQAIASAQLDDFSLLLASQSVSERDWQNARASLLSVQQELRQLEREKLNVSQNLSQQRHKLASLPVEERNALVSLQTRLSDLLQRRNQIRSQQQQVITATQAGTVASVQVAEGQYVTLTKPLLTLLPGDASVQARLLIPARSAGFVSPGQSLAIRYDAFPYQKFGLYRGQVSSISKTVVLPGELTAAPVNLNEPAYVVRASLQDLSISAYGQPVTLKSGMTFTADITLSERSLAEWLLDPLLSLSGRV